ncbi:hypothetical protein SEA_ROBINSPARKLES_106 [Gordonia phage RobinSparkles]|nr:hypothetical protein SEA_ROBINSPARKLES_106 [Gordonia phage RobinSparkles]
MVTVAVNDYVIVYKSELNNEWRWVRKAGNHLILSTSSEGYAKASHARRMAGRCNPGSPVMVDEKHFSRKT